MIRDASVGFHLTLSDHLIRPHMATRTKSRPHGSERDLAFKWPNTRQLLLSHEVQESLHVCLCVARLGNIRRLLQLLQSHDSLRSETSFPSRVSWQPNLPSSVEGVLTQDHSLGNTTRQKAVLDSWVSSRNGCSRRPHALLRHRAQWPLHPW